MKTIPITVRCLDCGKVFDVHDTEPLESGEHVCFPCLNYNLFEGDESAGEDMMYGVEL